MLRSLGQIIALILGGLVLILASVAAATTLGPADISAVNVRDIVANHFFGAQIPVKVAKDAIVWEERIPRALVAACCGAGLSLCGVVMQALLRNPLADPYLLGVSSGASTGAVVVGVLGVGTAALTLSTGAFVGAMLAFGFVLLLARLSGGTTDKVILAGIAATQLFSAATSLVVFAFADSDEARGVMFWLLGSLEGLRWDDVALCVVVVVIGVAICWSRAHVLDAFAFGDTIAASLGIHVRATRAGLLSLTAVLTAALVAVTGAIGFLGLVVPHAARLIVGATHGRVVPVAVIVGAVFMVWVDALSRVVFSPSPLPAGVGTALVGVPVFIALLCRRKGAL